MDGLTGVGAGDACTSKKTWHVWNCWHFRKLRMWIHYIYSCLTIKSETGQFVWCLETLWYMHEPHEVLGALVLGDSEWECRLWWITDEAQCSVGETARWLNSAEPWSLPNSFSYDAHPSHEARVAPRHPAVPLQYLNIFCDKTFTKKLFTLWSKLL